MNMNKYDTHKINFLICYDIRHPKRLHRLGRLISNHAMQVQYSVYYTTLYPSQMNSLIKTIKKIIKPSEDDVRIYVTPPLERAFIIGKRCPDIMMFGENGDKMQW